MFLKLFPNYNNINKSRCYLIVGNIINGGGYDARENQPLSARVAGPQSALGNVLNGGDDGQPAVVRGRRQAPGGNSTLVLN